MFFLTLVFSLNLSQRKTKVNKPLLHQDEYTFMQHFTSGEKHAFTAVYAEYHLRVYEYALRFLPSSVEAEDVTADSFLKLWQRKNEFGSLDHIRAFLFTTVKNACINILQHTHIKNEKQAALIHRLSNDQQGFYLEELRAELMQLVYAEVEKLPAKMKAIFLLSYKDGLKPTEIAERLNISVQTVSNQKTNAINLLKLALGNQPLFLALLLCLDAGSTVHQQMWTA